MAVYKNKENNTWYVKYKNKTKRGFKTKNEAKEYEVKMIISFESEIYSIDIYDVADDFLCSYIDKVTYGTYHKTEYMIENIIKPNIKNKDIHRVTSLECRHFRECIERTDYSTAYKNEILNTYKTIFKHAKRYFNLKSDPTYVLDPFKKKFQEKLKKREREMNIWTDEEFRKFIRMVDKDVYRELFIILYYTGMRLGEALALTWSDFYDGQLHIEKSLTRKTKNGSYEIKEPKNIASYRNVYLGKYLNDHLKEFQKREMNKKGYCSKWFIFGGSSPLPQTNIDRAKNKAATLANVRKIRMHDFRHSHASNLIANGMNIVAVSKRLGHSDVNMTLQVYTHLIKRNEDEVTAYISSSSQNLLNGPLENAKKALNIGLSE